MSLIHRAGRLQLPGLLLTKGLDMAAFGISTFLLVACALLFSATVEAATYNLSAGQYPPCSSKSWTANGNTYVCNYGKVTLNAGDAVVANASSTLWAENGFLIDASVVGSSAHNIMLRSSYGVIITSGGSSAGTVIFGSVVGASVTLGGTTVKGSVTGSGGAVMVNSEIEGNVGFNNEITLTNTIDAGFVESANREITLSGGSVGGGVNSSGGAGVFIDGTTVQGDISSANIISIEDSKVTGNVGSSCCKVTVTSSSVQGDIFTQGNPIELNGTDVVGTVSNTNKIYLNSSFVYGDVLAATGWGSQVTIQGIGNSRIYGQCAYSGVSPTYLCSDSKDINELLPLYLRFDEATWRNATVRNSGTLDMVGSASGAAETAGATPALASPWGTCRYGKFSGTGLVSVPHSAALSFSNELSASFWLNVSELPTSGSVALLDKGDNYRLELDSSGRLVLRVNTRSRELVISTVVGEGWNHVGFNLEYRSFIFILPTINANIYINGKLKVSGSDTAIVGLGPVINNRYLNIGGVGSNGLRGFIDEVRLGDVLWGATEFGRQARARHWCGSSSAIDHFEFVTGEGAHTCSPQTVTLKACTNAAPAACQPYPGTVSVTLAGNGWVGGSNQSLVNGTGSFKLQGLALQMPLGLSASNPPSAKQTLCQVGKAPLSSECNVTFSQSGFIFEVPDMLADQEKTVHMRAVVNLGDAKSPHCEPAFTDSSVPREVRFWSSFVTPSESDLTDSSQRVIVNKAAVGQTFEEATSLALRFDKEGFTSLAVKYSEAGRMLLNAYYPGGIGEKDSGAMSGSDSFVFAPAGFCVQPSETCSNKDSHCDVFRKVGQVFSTTITPVGWPAEGDLCSAKATVNYRQGQIKVSPVVQAPSRAIGGKDGKLLLPVDSHYDHFPPGSPAGWDGTITQDIALSEVGVFRLRVEPPPYLGVAVPVSESAPIGRFIPHHLKASIEGVLSPGCGVFSYQDQPVGFSTPPTLTITGYGVSEGTEYPTDNYDFDGFWGFSPGPSPSWLEADREVNLAAKLKYGNGDPDELEWQEIESLSPRESGKNNGDGQRTYIWDADWLRYLRAAQPGADDHPFQLRLRFAAEALTDRDGVCHGSACESFGAILGQSEFRLGRLRIGNGHGSELQDLSLPWVIETWQASSIFRPEAGDTCSATVWGNAQATEQVGNLAGKDLRIDGGKIGYEGSLIITKPDATGEARIGFQQVPEWLWYDWQDVGREASQGLASFGIYHGPKPLIFRREIYRGM
ncbi:hypothetical protein DQ403_03750 [Stutzerimonas zhaodongensis]|uniref:DUF6701 domain-containing protein n=1 Tax=Stutzerimonas zhaodongensis TaxID=1176257 RepID=A0A365PYK5_9GAMM|nr:hypothetical protein DQ403_03750 [Stutzerimonas zhaodongensis]